MLLFKLLLIGYFLLLYALIEPYLLRIKKYKINVSKTYLKGLKIIFLSDIHFSSIVSETYLRRMVKKVNRLYPDLILLGGDYVSHSEKYIKGVFNILKDLRAPLGIYGVLGNHDVDVNKTLVMYHLKKAGFKSIDNDSYRINIGNDTVKLIGVSDYLRDKPEIDKSIKDLKWNDYVILVSHNPDYAEEIKNYKIDLMLSGHTHGGQVTLFGYALSIPSKYGQKFRTGLVLVNKIKVIISNGIGCVGIPLRFFAFPQIVLVELN